MAEPILSLTHLTKTYANKTAVRDVSFKVMPGEIIGLLGPNGAGKTTIINMILSVLAATSGEIKIAGYDLQQSRVAALSHTNFAAVYAPLPGNLTVLQNLRFFARLYAVAGSAERIEKIIAQLGLHPLRHVKAGLLSSGEQSKLCLAKAMLNNPALLLLDEPTASLDPATAADMRAHIKAQARDCNTGILWTSHNMQEVEDMCDRILFLHDGEVILDGDPKTLPKLQGSASLEDLFITLVRREKTHV